MDVNSVGHTFMAWITRCWASGRIACCDVRLACTSDSLQAMANRLGKQPAQVVLRWALQMGVVIIPRSANPNHMRENLDLFTFYLRPKQMARISSMSMASNTSGVSAH